MLAGRVAGLVGRARSAATGVRALASAATDEKHFQTSLTFAVSHRSGALHDALDVLRRHNVNMSRIESRPSRTDSSLFEFVVDVDGTRDSPNVSKCLSELTQSLKGLTVIGSYEVPWFPRKMSDLDVFVTRVLSAGAELESDHPGFTDPEYRKRRHDIADIALNYKIGDKIPRVEYTDNERETWGIVYDKLSELYPKHACREHNMVFELLQRNCGYSRSTIPQLQDISEFLQSRTGFRLRPITGLLSSRDFLNGLAFRVFHSTQYMRHHTRPTYTPEPDLLHELMGHVPLFANPDFADLSQQIGLASLGASDEDVLKLATVYWHSVEFGLIQQDGERKAYGAGLLSSFGELEYSMGGEPEVRPFEPEKAAVQEYPITTYQPVYFMAESFEDAKNRLRTFGQTMKRPFAVRYNPLTQSTQVLNSTEAIMGVVDDLSNDMAAVKSALHKLHSG